MRLCRTTIAMLVFCATIAAAEVPATAPSLPAGGKPLISEAPISSYKVLDAGRRYA